MDTMRNERTVATTEPAEPDAPLFRPEVLAVANQTMEPTAVSLWLRPPMERSGRSVH